MNNFYAMLSRMKYINRWALMRNSYTENISEHSLEVSIIAHALALIGNRRLGKSLNADRAAVIAIFHDATEIITGDMPTPIKYFNSDIRSAFKDIEEGAAERLLALLPEDLRDDYVPAFFPDKDDPSDAYLMKLVKAADKLSALIKCREEEKMGNHEFSSAGKTLFDSVKNMKLPEADIFVEEFLPAYSLTLDELQS